MGDAGRARTAKGPLHLALFGFDQVLEPADVALRGVQLVLHERERVAVDPLPVFPQRFLEGRASPLQEGPAPLEQADSRLGLEVPEEREPDREPVVLGGLLPNPLLRPSWGPMAGPMLLRPAAPCCP